ncbi:hypothetical protein AMTR_s00088p00166360 [Amborella trichopoda]|uniref:Uncharacterized protein n=1 Tax=Amborella trichopoda TaxID=13333 RepID=W1NY55_AMBTC|nr:hypothetical protein AMTR_s00088p00166360 [Amborella trichopoda]
MTQELESKPTNLTLLEDKRKIQGELSKALAEKFLYDTKSQYKSGLLKVTCTKFFLLKSMSRRCRSTTLKLKRQDGPITHNEEEIMNEATTFFTNHLGTDQSIHNLPQNLKDSPISEGKNALLQRDVSSEEITKMVKCPRPDDFHNSSKKFGISLDSKSPSAIKKPSKDII